MDDRLDERNSTKSHGRGWVSQVKVWGRISGLAGLIGLPGLWSASAALPDLTLNTGVINPQIVTRTFASDGCEVMEGCVSTGTRTLVLFNTVVNNVGSADLVMGNPASNPLFEYSACHQHYHFRDFAVYNLLDASASVLVLGHKTAFCLMDSERWDSSANPNPHYDCNNQGIQKGWADVYDPTLPCQWLDVTGLPGGNYTLQIVLNPSNRIAEASMANNTTLLPITLPEQCQTPANDNFGSPELISGLPASVVSYNSCATTEPSEPWLLNNGGGASVWFSWTAPASGNVRVSTTGSDFNTLLGVYTGSSIPSMTLVAANNDMVAGSVLQSAVNFNAVAGTTYRITVDGYRDSGGVTAMGRIQLNLNPPTNDLFRSCQSISGSSGTVTGWNVGGTGEPGETAHAGSVAQHSVWYCWSPAATGPVVFDTLGSDFDTVLGVYTGSSVNALTLVGSSGNVSGGVTSRVMFNAVSGVTYHLAVDGSSGATGQIVLNWNPPSRLTIAREAGGGMALSMTGGPGAYQLQWSPDLSQWNVLVSFSLSTTGQYHYTDASGAPGSTRFYRAVLVP